MLIKVPMLKREPNRSKTVLYTGIFVTDEIKLEIQNYFMKVSNSELLPSTTDCHLTIRFKPSDNPG
jgi:hypothetical protein